MADGVLREVSPGVLACIRGGPMEAPPGYIRFEGNKDIFLKILKPCSKRSERSEYKSCCGMLFRIYCGEKMIDRATCVRCETSASEETECQP